MSLLASEAAAALDRAYGAEWHARCAVVRSARKLSACAAEFDGDLQYCGEHLNALWDACDKYGQAEEAVGKAEQAFMSQGDAA